MAGALLQRWRSALLGAAEPHIRQVARARRRAVHILKSLPPDVLRYQRTREFSEATVPTALRGRHTTKPGVWGRICVLDGFLRYRILAPEPEEHMLSPEHPGVVEPGIPHQVEPLGKVRFYVEFLRRPK